MKIELLNLAGLKYFIDTVETQSLTDAAAKNFVSRPAVSQAIRRLEVWAGADLLTHKKKSLQLTKEGEQFYRRAKLAFDHFQADIEKSNIESNTLKFGCSSSFIDDYLIHPLKHFKNTYALEIKIGRSTDLKRYLQEGSINIAVYIDEPNLPGFSTEVLSKGQFIVASKDGKLSDTLIMTEDRPEVLDLKNYLYRKKIFPKIIKAESWKLGARLAEALGGSCLIPEFLLPNQLKKVSLPNYKSEYKTILAHRRNELLSELEVKFCEQLRKNKTK